MWAPSKDPDDYLPGQDGTLDSRARPPARVTVPVYAGTIALATLLAWALGVRWSTAFPIGLITGGIAQLAVIA